MITADNSMVLRRWRGLALELIYASFRNRGPAIDHVMLSGMMQRLGQNICVNDVIFVLRWLKDCHYVEYIETKNRYTNEVSIAQLKITRSGCDVAEGIAEDPAILIL